MNRLEKVLMLSVLLICAFGELTEVKAQDYSLRFLPNEDFTANLGYWFESHEIRAQDPANQPGSVEWSSEYGGSAHLTVSGAPSEVSLVGYTNTILYPGDSVVCHVTHTDMTGFGSFGLRIGGDYNDFSVDKSSSPGGESDVILSITNFYLPGTPIRMWLVVWPGSGEAWVHSIHLMRGGQVASIQGGFPTITTNSGLPTSPFTKLYPNPSNSGVKIGFELKREGDIKLSIYNILGRKVNEIERGRMALGYHEVFWDGTDVDGANVASGTYYYQLSVGDHIYSKKSIMLR